MSDSDAAPLDDASAVPRLASCTAEVILCPDGSSVGRTPPRCIAKCPPVKTCSKDADCGAQMRCVYFHGCSQELRCVLATACPRQPTEYCGCDGKTVNAPAGCPTFRFDHPGPC